MTERQNELERIRSVYDTAYPTKPQDRKYTWHPRNLVSVYYRQAQERALIALFNAYDIHIEQAKVLDIGCGKGAFLRFLASLGTHLANLHGLDLMSARIQMARDLSPPPVDFCVGNAEHLPYPDESFDLVSQFTVFSSVLDRAMRNCIAREMRRVLRTGGYILWYDMRRARSQTTRGIEAAEVRQLFPGCRSLTLQGLHPPYASSIVRRSWLLGTLWDLVPGIKKTHYIALLRKD